MRVILKELEASRYRYDTKIIHLMQHTLILVRCNLKQLFHKEIILYTDVIYTIIHTQ